MQAQASCLQIKNVLSQLILHPQAFVRHENESVSCNGKKRKAAMTPRGSKKTKQKQRAADIVSAALSMNTPMLPAKSSYAN